MNGERQWSVGAAAHVVPPCERDTVPTIVIIDLSQVPFDVCSSVISLILRCLFDFSYWHRRVFTTRFPIAVFADEAHIYLNDSDPATEAAKHSAERIAKEGRKYGISLTVISQRRYWGKSLGTQVQQIAAMPPRPSWERRPASRPAAGLRHRG